MDNETITFNNQVDMTDAYNKYNEAEDWEEVESEVNEEDYEQSIFTPFYAMFINEKTKKQVQIILETQQTK